MVKKSIEEIQARANGPNNKRGNSRRTRVYGDENEPRDTDDDHDDDKDKEEKQTTQEEIRRAPNPRSTSLSCHTPIPLRHVQSPAPGFRISLCFRTSIILAHEIKQRGRSLSTGATCLIPRITRRSWSWSLLLPNPCDVYDRTDDQDWGQVRSWSGDGRWDGRKDDKVRSSWECVHGGLDEK